MIREWLSLKFIVHNFFYFSFLTLSIIFSISSQESYYGKESIVYVIQELPGTRVGRPKYNIMGALKYGKLKVLLKEDTQIVLSPGPIIFELRRLLKDYNSNDYLLLSGDPAVIGLACAIVSDINNGKFNLLKWDRQEKVYYPLEINLYEKGKVNE